MHCTVIHGHRGARGLAPENTLGGFSLAMAIGVSALELDVNVSADQRIVIHHDPRLNPVLTRDYTGDWLNNPGPLLSQTPFEKLCSYDIGRLRPGSDQDLNFPHQIAMDGQHIPTLAEVANLLHERRADQILLNIEAKCNPNKLDRTLSPADFATLLVRELDASGLLERCWIQSFNWHFLQALQGLEPTLRTGYLTAEQPKFDTIGAASPEPSPWLAGFDPRLFNFSIPNAVRAAGGDYWGPNFRDLCESRVQEAHDCCLGVYAWTVNEPEDIARLHQWRVDGVTTDYPDTARSTLGKAGSPLPYRYPVSLQSGEVSRGD